MTYNNDDLIYFSDRLVDYSYNDLYNKYIIFSSYRLSDYLTLAANELGSTAASCSREMTPLLP